ncbi:non-ribosomal peptide synthase/polyketide synthase [Cytobacillus sp. FSL K6-0129]|uniref:non-ribosomal peptide synthase/polyketide synthase n=1 Tax=Cytobacillus sp. FSL K6-0129 TaxID=2921421 RepID=UPI0030F73BD3
MLKQGNVQDILYLSPLQEGILYHYQRNPQSSEYYQQLSLKINRVIELDKFKKAWEHVVRSNECLRTVFKWKKLSRPVQVVIQRSDLNFNILDISDEDESNQHNLVRDYKGMDKNKIFSLDKEPPFRIQLIKMSDTSYELLISYHHIILDGWSLGIILKEFLESYDNEVSGLPHNYINKGSYKEYINYINEYNKDKNLAFFWLDYLKDVSPNYLGIDNENTPKKMEYQSLVFSSELFLNIEKYLKENKVTLAAFIYSIWGILLHKYHNKNDIVFGTTVSGRSSNISNLENTAGLFINTIPCKVAVNPNQTVREIISKTNMELIDRSLRENTSLVNINNYLDLKRGQQLFDSLIVIENYPLDNLLNNYGHHLNFDSFSIEEETNYNLVLTANLIDGLNITFSYNNAVFPINEVDWLIKKFYSLVEQVVQNYDISLTKLSLLSFEEQKQILEEFNDTQVDYRKDLTIQALFEEQVEKTPNKVAVVVGNQEMTYNELNARSNQLAHTLRDRGVKPDDVVAIMVERSFEMIVSIMGVLKAGAAYLPIDPELPIERINYMLKDSRTEILVSQVTPSEELTFEGVCLSLEKESVFSRIRENPIYVNKAQDLAYVIYTSGSTGKPKGVMIEHQSVINRLMWMQRKYPLSQSDSILQKTPYMFDVSVWELFWWALSGARLCFLAPNEEKNPSSVINAIKKYGITTIHFVPTMLDIFVKQVKNNQSKNTLVSLRRIFVSGEELKWNQVQHYNQVIGKEYSTELINLYGPTEATVDVSYFDVKELTDKVVPIGKPIDNIHLYVVNEHVQLQPIGVPGELCIAGDGVARGYLGNPTLTAEKFVENPFVPGERMYKTGDLARWLPDGNIEFLGRIDHQVKIRGFRIELGEIENTLLSHPLVQDTVVISRKEVSDEDFLCAYIVASQDASVSELRTHLAKTLPDYMIPSYFVPVDALPLNANGKVDRKALPEPKGYLASEVPYVAPQTDIQQMVVDIWQEVLGVEQPIGIHDNFFELGGHSLRATTVMAKIHQNMDVEVPLRVIFQSPTIEEIASYIEKAQKQQFKSIKVVEKQPYYPVSAAQKRMYILNQMDKQSTSYNMPAVLTLEGSVDFTRLENAFNQLVERHEAFRTEFIIKDGVPVQRVVDSVPFSVQVLEKTEVAVEEQIQSFIQPFDLQQAPLLRVGLLQESEEQHILIIDMHHIISDGHSLTLLTEEFSTLYADGALPDLRIQYKDYAVWQQSQLKSDEMKEHKEYWLKQFESGIPILDLPTDYPRPAVQSYEGDSVDFTLSQEVTEKLREIAKKHNVTMYMLLFAAYNTLLYKYTGQEEIVVGTPIAGRTHADMEKIVGMFVNTLALKMNPRGDMAFSEFLAQVKSQTLEAYQHQDYQFEELVEQLDVERDMSRHPLFDTMFNFETIDSQALSMADLIVEPYTYESLITKFDLTLGITETNDGLMGAIEFSQKLFKRETIERWKTHFIELLTQLSVNGEDQRIADIGVLTQSERKQILEEFNDTQVDYRKDLTIQALFEEQVEKTPNKVAVVVGNQEMTYNELNARSNQLAHTLRDRGVKPDDVVAIMVERSFEMIVSIMGVLKAGAAYLPIDPELPIERINYMLKDSRTEILVSQVTPSEELTFEGVCLSLEKESVFSRIRENPIYVNKAQDLAYVIYTSGSTGKPKGVMIEHLGIHNLVKFMERFAYLNEKSRIIQFATFSFDASIYEIFATFICGAKLYIPSKEEILSVNHLSEFLQENNITHGLFPPAVLNQLDQSILKGLEVIISGGSRCSKEIVAKCSEHSTFINAYGPSEITVIATAGEFVGEHFSIGKPINNTKIYIYDSDNNLQPIGVPGELCVAGDGVAQGYFGNPTLTAEKFVENPFVPGERMYKTGDLARWLPDGNIEFLGRIDHQVKIRGFRIELGEIENTLLSHPLVQDTVVISRKEVSDEDFLCAYIVASQDASVSELRTHLAKTLPDYMIPSYFVPVDALPLNANGKVDRKALPEPKGYLASEVPYVAPQTDIQQMVVDIWQEVLGVEQPIGIHDNFFELGGHSLRATTVMAKIHQNMDVEVPLRVIFQSPTIEEIASYIEKAQKQQFKSIKVVEKQPYYPVSAAQKRMYILNQMDKQSTSYNMPAVLTLEGSVDFTRLENAFNQLVERHEAFRTEFIIKDGVPVQRVVDSVPFSVQVLEKTEVAVEEQIQSFIQPFDLQQAPLLRVGLLQESEEQHILIIDMHHIISDGHSLTLLTEEFSTLYADGALPDLRIQYKDYAVWQQSQLKSDEMKEHKEYWLKQFESGIPILDLPTDYPRPAVQSYEGDSVDFTLSQEVTEKLREIAKKHNVTMYMLLFAAYNTLLYKYTGQEEIVVGTPIAGRTHADMEKIVGMFVNTLALKMNPRGDMAFSEFLAQVKSQTLEAYQHQDYQFEELVEQLDVERDMSRHPLFDTMFNFETIDSQALSMADLIVEPYTYESLITKFDLTLGITETNDGLMGAIEFSQKLFKRETIERWKTHFIELLTQLSMNGEDQQIADIEVLTQSEQKQILEEFNNTQVDYRKNLTIQAMFEEQVEKTPNKVAVVVGNQKMTYREINEKANQLAYYLHGKGISRNKLVGVLLEKSFDFIVSILAIMKAGGGFMPLEPKMPKERVKRIVDNSGISFLLTNKSNIDLVKTIDVSVIRVDTFSVFSNRIDNLKNENRITDLLYVLYSSGTTGTPKGIMQNHKTLGNLLSYEEKQLKLQSSVISQFASIGFDVCYQEIFSALLFGGKLVLIDDDAKKDTRELLNIIEYNKVNILFLPTAFLKFFGRDKQFLNALSSSINHIIVAGETLVVPEELKRFLKVRNVYLHNHYGPTETHVVTANVINANEGIDTYPYIGKPINNTKIYIYDSDNNLQPIGVPGELCVAGDGVAQGYLGNPTLTAEKFVENPFVPGERMYKTGDLARWLPDGNIEFLGRIDHQVKIRGFRIELGEIENTLLSHPLVQDTVVISRKEVSDEDFLCAYIVASQDASVSELRTHLAKTLPDYMIPSYFVPVDALPLNANGKVDRKALPEPKGYLASEVPYVAPQTDIQQMVVDIWQEVLGVEQPIGIHDNFFELGGHSLRATTVMAKIHQNMDVEVPLRVIFQSPTIEEIASYIEKAQKQQFKSIKVVEKQPYYPVSAAQKRMYILNQMDKQSTSYNMPAVLTLEGSVDFTRLENAFNQLVERHEAFRTEFIIKDGVPVQRVVDSVPFSVQVLEKTEVAVEEQIQSFIQPFDLQQAPLLRVGLLQESEEQHILIIDMHHIISDGHSLTLLTEEFSTLYADGALPDLRIQYKDYAVWQQSQLKSDEMKEHKEYWLKQFESGIPILDLPTDYPRPAVQSYEGDSVDFTLSQEVTEKLREIAKKHNVTMYMLLFAAYNTLLYKYTGQEEIVVGTPIAGRTHADMEKIVGMFVNTLALKMNPRGDMAFSEFLAQVKSQTLEAYQHQDYQFEELVEQLDVERDMSRHPLFDTMFNFETIDSQALSMADLIVEPYTYESLITKFDLTLGITETNDGLMGAIEFSQKLFKRETIERWKTHFIELLTQLSMNGEDQQIADIEVLTQSEQKQILEEFNNTQVDYRKNLTIQAMFEEQVEKTPNKVAVVVGNQKMTYREINEKANQLAYYLHGKGISRNKLVGVLLEKSFDFIVSILAIMKAGGGFMPLEPKMPKERVKRIVDNSGISFLLTNKSNIDLVKTIDVSVIRVDTFSVFSNRIDNLKNENRITDLLYVLYSSGTTGTPKGIMQNHKTLGNLLSYEEKQLKLQSSVISQFASIGFDVCYQEIFSALLFGGKLVLIDDDAKKDTRELLNIIEYNKVNILFLPTAFLKFFGRDKQFLNALSSSINHIIVAGETLVVPEELKRFLKVRNVYLHNHYGPTETHVVTANVINANEGIDTYPYIGKPINNTKIYIYDSDNNLQPIGVPGELCVAGDGVAQGYLGNPTLTAEKFVENPFVPGERMYKTGDLARWLPDGNIEFLGRIDHQVKIRGFRIELGEIENTLLSHPLVQDTVVISRKEVSDEDFLCAYIVASQDASVSELRTHLAKTLPDYMIPSYFVPVDALPLNANGKVDRKALPEPKGYLASEVPYVAPQTDIQQMVVDIWQEVLGVEQPIGIHDNFFELGGHSLRATTVMAKIHQNMDVEVPLRVIFQSPTIEEIASYIEKAQKQQFKSIKVVEKQPYYPVSAAQKRMYILNQMDKQSTSYNMPAVLTLEGSVDFTRLENAFNQLVERHEAFRTEFIIKDGVPVQRVVDSVPFSVQVLEKTEVAVEEQIQSFIQPFDLQQAPLLRVGLLQESEEQHILIIDMHHIISDGHSLTLLTEEFSTLYADGALPDLRIQYKDYAVWQQSQLKSDEMKEHKEYWLKQFESGIPILDLPTDYPRPAVQSYEGDSVDFTLSQEVTEKLREIAKKHNVTMYMLLFAAYNTLLYKYTGQEEIVVGTPIAGRTHADMEKIVGMFVNTLALKMNPRGDMAFSEFLAQVKSQTLEAYQHQDYQFEELVEQLDVERDMSRHPLFDTMFNFETIDSQALSMADLIVEPYTYESLITKFDLSFGITETNDGLMGAIEFSQKLFKRETIERWKTHFIELLTQLSVNGEDQRIADIGVLTQSERKQILEEFNDTQVDYRKDLTIQALFEEQVEKTPNKVAVVVGNQEMTYNELNARSNQLAHTLRDRGVKPDDVVAIMVERSFEMIVSIMGVLKAGAAYLPIDPELPIERINYMLKDSRTEILVSQVTPSEELTFEGVCLSLEKESVFSRIRENPIYVNKAQDLAYVIYTSGSTGKPKGVMIEHQSVINRLMWMQRKYPLSQSDSILQKTPYMFDVSVWELFWWALSGARLCFLAPNEEKNPSSVINAIKKYGITTIHFVPTMLDIFVKQVKNNQSKNTLVSLRRIFVSGEELKWNQVQHYNQVIGKEYSTELINLYGPTEATVDVSYFDVKELTDKVVPIGKPIDNIHLYVVNEHVQLQPIGVPGELCIAGDGVARGYLGNPTLTAEKFVENPFVPGERMYKTGDLARWLPDGNIEFLGRIDHQVKIRGFRIELGEIENTLLSHPLVQDTVVISRKEVSDEDFLCAYIVASQDASVSELRTHLAKTLPDYMIPSYFVPVDALPLNANGKVDRKALPEPKGYLASEVPYVAPQTDIQQMVVDIWQEVLGVEQPIGIHDNFFELGGHSLRATTVMAKIHQNMDVEVPLRVIFQSPTIEEIASYIEKAQKQQFKSIKVVEKQPYYPVSAAQKRMYILNQMDKQSTSYNMPAVLTLEGSVDFTRLENAFNQLVERHEAFRTEFIIKDGVPVQRVVDSVPFSVQVLEKTEVAVEEQIQSFIQPFDLQQAPLLRVGLLQESEEQHILIIDMHHIISDGHSLTLLTEEFSTLYADGALPDLRIQYKDYAVWQQSQLKSDEMKEHKEYWLKQFESGIPILDLPTDYPRPVVQSYEGDSVDFTLSQEVTEKLREIAKKHNVTMYMLLFAAYNTLLYKYTGQEEIVVGTPIAGRTHADMEKIVGMFVNTLALKMNPRGDMAFSEFLAQVKSQTLEAYQHQDYQFEELVEQLDVERDMSRHPLFDTMFNFETIDSQALSMADLIVEPYTYESLITKFDLTLGITETNDGLMGAIEFSQKLFKRETIERWKTHFIELLTQLSVNGEDQRIADIGVLTQSERKQILEEFNDTQVDYRKDLTIQALFEEQVEKTPNKVAVVVGNQEMTYNELNARSNQLAHTLRDRGVKPDDVVAIMVERSFEMIVSIMGVLKAGAAYLPIDPELPIERINYMLKDSRTEILVSQVTLSEELTFEGVCLSLEKESVFSRIRENPINVNKAQDLAYVIYTSGSTGKPKGVMIEHQSVMNIFFSMLNNLNFNGDYTTLSLTTISFDIFVLETIFPITSGMKVIIEKEKHDEVFLKELIGDSNINTLQLTPSRFKSLMRFEGFSELLSNIETLLIGGEAISRDLIEIIKRHTKNDIYNVYGPTETTIWSTVKVLSHGDELSIGKPINNTRIYIYDPENNLQPIGIPGELCIAGDGVARGYLGNPTLTAEKFVENPFVPGERMYKTGDLARWLPDGNIEFLGRIDHQVKIRGFRIELGEIENTLLSHPLVQDTVVISRKEVSDEDFLCAYIVASQDASVSELRTHLAKTLPDYMIPSYFVPVDALPLNANGKVDRKALPEPKGYLASEVPYVAPQTDIQQMVVDIWQEVLGVEQPIGIHDNFFELGGHSLRATTVMAKIHQNMDVEVPLRVIFQSPTIEEIASYIEKAQKQQFKSIKVVEKQPYYPVSAAQKRMYILNQMDKQSTSYNMPAVLTLEGSVDFTRLENAFNQLVERHEAFRTEFIIKDGVPVQRVVDSVPFSVQVLEKTEVAVEEQIQSFIQPFDLQQAPLLRVGLLQESEEQHILIIDMHHIISDGHSLTLLTEEFSTLYADGALPDLRIQYKDYAVWQQSQLKSDEMKEHKEYWLKQFESGIPILDLPTDYPRPVVQSYEGDSVDFTLSQEVTEKLREIAKKHNVTMYMLLFAAYNTLLYKYTGQEEIVVGTPIAGRTHADMEKIVGMFVNTLALKMNPRGDMALSEFLAQVKSQTLEAYQHQDYQFEELVERLGLERNTGRHPLFDTMFVLQNNNKVELEFNEIKLTSSFKANKTSKFDLWLGAEENQNKINLTLEYSSKLFHRKSIEVFINHFQQILTYITTDDKLKIEQIKLNYDSFVPNNNIFIDEEKPFSFS